MPSSPQEVWQSSTAPGVITINDFSPGIQRFSRGGYLPTYSSNAPLGSAATAFRCYAVPGVGLCPFPTYTTTIGTFLTNSANNSWMGMCGLRSMGLLPAMNTEQLIYTFMYYDATNTHFNINSIVASGTTLTGSALRYSAQVAGNSTFQTPNIVTYFDLNSGVSVISMDPIGLTGTQQRYVQWSGTANAINVFNIGAGDLFFDLAKLLVQSSRLVFIQISRLASGSMFTDYRISDPPQSPISVLSVFPSKLEPSQVFEVGSWGSIDSGEMFVIGQQGGALYITGDVFAPSSVVKLPGVASTGAIIGPAALSSSGYIYLSDTGVYIWNGGNTSQKISSQIPDDVLWRTAGFTFNPVPAQRPQLTHHDVWGDWVMFANNWMFNTITGSWWQVEDPAVALLQLHTPSAISPRFFFSSADYVLNNSGGAETINLPLYAWDRNLPASSYVWLSNPIPTTVGDLVILHSVEIVASNPSPTAATITITPTAPTGQTPYPGNNPQSATFTIPPTTSSYRAQLPLGYTDYNLQIQVNAANVTPPNEAPIIHQISLFYANKTSAVSP